MSTTLTERQPLTERQQEVFDFIRDYRASKGYCCTVREVVGQRSVPIGHSFAGETYQGEGNTGSKTADITAPSTDAAKQWQGWTGQGWARHGFET